MKLKKIIKKNYKWLLPVVIAAGVGSWFLYQRLRPSQEQLTFESPQRRDLVKSLEVSGVVDAKRKARMRFIAGGKITYLGAQEGDWVEKWQTLATIDQRDLQKRLDKTLNTYMQERWDWEQTLDDTEDRWLDTRERRQVDKEQWDLENRVLDVEIQSIAISNTVMSSPLAGVLVTAPTTVSGVQVLSSDYFEVVDPQSLVFKAEVDEEDISTLNMNQPAKLTLDAYEDLSLDSQVDYIGYQSLEAATGTVFVVEFPISTTEENPLNKYRLGMNGDANIELARAENVLAIPTIAVIQRDGQYFVEVRTDDNQIEERVIETGLETEDWIEVTSGLNQEDEIVIPETES